VSPQGPAVAELAARIAAPEGRVELVAVADPVQEEGREALGRSAESASRLHAVETSLLEGGPAAVLLAEIRARGATLAVVGSHGRSRAVGIALGSVTTFLLHEAPCSVLVARPPAALDGWPQTIVAGVDGSEESAAALAVARRLAARFGAALHAVVATRDPHADLDAARRAAGRIEELPGRAVDELVHAAERADLLVLGSRGLRGLRSLGSVSERVAHEAACSVLVVRSG
jgi:nucleotide-binding universal stress UspA family protein